MPGVVESAVLERLIELAPDGVVVVRLGDGEIVAANQAFADVVGVAGTELIGSWCGAIGLWPVPGERAALLHERPGPGPHRAVAARVRTEARRWRDLELSVELVDIDGAGHAFAIARDVTERRAAEQALRADEARFRALVHRTRDAILVTDPEGVLTYCSPGVEYLLGYRPEELEGTRERALVHPGDLAGRERVVGRLAEGLPDVAGQLRLRRRDGAYRWVDAISTNGLDTPAVRGIVTTVRDITERRATEETLAFRALHDPLTGLPNRILLEDRVANALAHAERGDKSLALLFCDLDQFKAVNDRLGHLAGDDLLRQMAERLTAILRPSDSLARVGGDEFVVLCDDVESGQDAEAVAQRISAAIAAPVTVAEVSLTVTVSIGIATVDHHAVGSIDPGTLIRYADAAMYRAKGLGRDRHEVFDAEMLAQARRRSQLEAQLRHALDADELTVRYQPVVRLADRAIVGAEALLRWHHPERGLLLPDDFLEVAESSGIIVPIGQWVLRQALTHLLQWQARRPEIWVAVNVSGRQLGGGGLNGVLEEAAVDRLVPGSLHLELTESVLIEHSKAVGADLDDAIASGAEIGIDDFGTGYSSMTYLQRHPVSFLKIDRSFVADLGPCISPDGENHAPALVDAIVQLGRTLDIAIIAEGIETVAQAEALAAMGCAYGQGYLYRPAVSADEMRPLVEAGVVA